MTADDWTNLPLSEVIYRWTSKNSSLPPEIVSTTIYVAIMISMWYTLMYIVRFIRFAIVRVVGPLLLFAIALAILGYFLQLIGEDKIKDLMQRV